MAAGKAATAAFERHATTGTDDRFFEGGDSNGEQITV